MGLNNATEKLLKLNTNLPHSLTSHTMLDVCINLNGFNRCRPTVGLLQVKQRHSKRSLAFTGNG